MNRLSVAILGATGYTGAELIRLINNHPNLRLAHVSAHSQAGKRLGAVLPSVSGELASLLLAEADAPLPADVSVVFAALPHGASARLIATLIEQGLTVVDLSADFRHATNDLYAQAYGQPHPCPHLLDQAVYGLTELNRAKLHGAKLVANPGCYPTTVLLPLVPLLKAGVLANEAVIVDSKSGASGAGRKASTDLLYCDLNEGVKAYGLPRHRHAFEMEEHLAGFAGLSKRPTVRFVPHILPMTRGMLTTLHLRGREVERWHAMLSDSYHDESFVRVLPPGQLPSTQGVRGSNRCDIGIVPLDGQSAVVVCCIDNLLKGASGQAVQNLNAINGWDETLGLDRIALWP